MPSSGTGRGGNIRRVGRLLADRVIIRYSAAISKGTAAPISVLPGEGECNAGPASAISVCVMLGIVCGGVLAQATGGAVEVSSTDPGAYYSTGALVDGQSAGPRSAGGQRRMGPCPSGSSSLRPGLLPAINSVTIDPYTGYPDLAGPFWPKDVVIQVISTPGAEPVEVARQTLDPGREAKTIEFAPTAAAQVRIEILSVQGGGNVVEISEVSAGTAAAAPTEDPAVPVEEPPVEEDPVTPPPAEEGPVTVPPGEEGPVTVPPVEEVPPPPVEEVPPPPVEEVPPPPVEEVPPPPVEEVPPPPVEEVPPPPVEEVPPPPVEEVPPPPVEEVPPPPAEDATTPAAGSVNLAAAAAGGVITVPNSLESKFGPEHLQRWRLRRELRRLLGKRQWPHLPLRHRRQLREQRGP